MEKILPNEIIIMIFKYTDITINMKMMIIFPYLKNVYNSPNCEYCEKKSHYIIKFKYDDTCRSCQHHKVNTKYKYICKLNCNGLYYYPSDYSDKLKINVDYQFNISYLCEKDDCNYCGRRIMYEVIGSGYQIQYHNKFNYQLIHNNIDEFIKLRLKKCSNSNLIFGEIIYAYKKFYKIYDLNFTESENKKFNKTLSQVLQSKLKFKNSNLLEYKFKNLKI